MDTVVYPDSNWFVLKLDGDVVGRYGGGPISLPDDDIEVIEVDDPSQLSDYPVDYWIHEIHDIHE